MEYKVLTANSHEELQNLLDRWVKLGYALAALTAHPTFYTLVVGRQKQT